MGVGADRQHARSDNALLRQDDVLDADAALLEVVDNVVFMRKVAYSLGKFCRFDVLGRLEMVRYKGDFRTVEDRTADFLEFLNGWRCRDIVGKYHIEIADHELSSFDRVETSVFRENLLAHSHTHKYAS